MGNNEKQNQIVMQNGNKLRKWVGTLFPVFLFLGGAIVVLANVGADIKKVDTKIDTKISVVAASLLQHKLTTCEKVRVITEKVDELKKEGSLKSRKNEKRIINIESDVKYTTAAVKRIEKIVENLAQRPH